MSLRDDINIPLIVVLGITTGLIVAVAIIGTQAGYNYVTSAELAKNYREAEDAGRLRFGDNVWKPQREAMDQPAAWADVTKSSLRIPLKDARQMMIDTKGKPPTLPSTQPAAPAGPQPATQPAGR